MAEDTQSLIRTIEEDVSRKREEERRKIEEETRTKILAEMQSKQEAEALAKQAAEEKAAMEAKMKQLEEAQAQLQEQLKNNITSKRGYVGNAPSPFPKEGGVDVHKLDLNAVEAESKRQFMLKSSGGKYSDY